MEASEAQKAARATWAAGDFDAIATYIWSVGADLVEVVGVRSGEHVLDVACGTGNAAIPAATEGAVVTGLDITPELFEPGRRRAADAGVEIDWVEGDAQDLPFDDESFDVVLSTFGCMFAPDHARAAAEIGRVLRPGGRMGIAAWTPSGGIGAFFGAIAEHAPPPPEGFQPPPLWGDRAHVEGLFADTGVEVRFEDAAVDFRFDGGIDEVMDEYIANFGPLVMLRAALEPEGRWPAALADIRAFYERVNTADDGGVEMRGEYLVTLGQKRQR